MADTPARPAFKGPIVNLMVDGCADAIDFYLRAFGAAELNRMTDDKRGRIMHSCLEINGGHLFLNDSFPEFGHPAQIPQAFVLHLQVDDAQAWWDRARAAGCEETMPLAVQFWGDNYGQLKDPYGITWSIGQTV